MERRLGQSTKYREHFLTNQQRLGWEGNAKKESTEAKALRRREISNCFMVIFLVLSAVPTTSIKPVNLKSPSIRDSDPHILHNSSISRGVEARMCNFCCSVMQNATTAVHNVTDTAVKW